MFKRLSLRAKLMSAFLVTALLGVVLSYVNVQGIQQTRQSFGDIVDGHLPRLAVLEAMRTVTAQLDKATYLYATETVTSESATQKARILTFVNELSDQESKYQTLATREDPNKTGETLTQFGPVAVARERVVTGVSELIALRERRASQAEIVAKEAELTRAESELERTINTVIEQDRGVIMEESRTVNDRVSQVTSVAIVGSVVSAVFALSMGLAIALSVVRNVNRLKVGSAKLAGGDFSSHIAISSRDELGDLATAFNKMSDGLRSSYRRLALEKERDETLLESMSEGMVALDEQGKIVLINSVAADMLNLKERSEGNSFVAKVPLLDEHGKASAAESLPTATLQTGQATSNVYGLQNGNARKTLLHISASPIKLEGKIAGAIFVLRDVTKEKEVDRMKTEFISLASHQLRTPLSAIKWFSEMLLNGDAGELQPEQKDFTKNIADSTDRMVDLVNSLLNISRIESGRIIVDPRPTDLQDLIGGIVNDLKAKTEERQQTLVISVHSDLPKINLDPRLIGQVYMNLLTNAIKYTPKKGEISVMVSKKGNDVISQVTDNGYGIPKAQQARIFEKFFRAENVAKVETDGTGLGLYLIKAIVESSGGKIWFESEEGKGTSFWFTLPLSGMKPKEGEVTLDA